MSQSYDRISLWGLRKYIKPDILDDFALPERLEEDRENIMDNVLLESAELELYYTDPDFLKEAIRVWSTKMIPNWNRILDALLAEYNPIENFDRHEEWSDTGTGQRSKQTRDSQVSAGNTRTDTNASAEGQSRNNIDSTSNGQNNTEQLNSNTGMNDPSNQGLVTHDKSEGSTVNATADHSESTTSSGSTNTSFSDTDTTMQTNGTGEETEINTSEGGHTGHLHGNIGVTTNQEMIEAEINLRRLYNIVDIIVDDFIKKFCLRVY